MFIVMTCLEMEVDGDSVGKRKLWTTTTIRVRGERNERKREGGSEGERERE